MIELNFKFKRILFVLALSLFAFDAFAYHKVPTLYINTINGKTITSRDQWTDSVSLRIVMPDSVVSYSTSLAQVKLRGHSTFTKPKKPFALKLDKKADILGMSPNKRWVLLANFMDHSNMRNSLALDAAHETSLDWTPDFRFVDVVVNGSYQGLYLLCEQVEVVSNRVHVQDNGGWLVKGDSYDDGKYMLRTSLKQFPFEVKFPKDPSEKLIRKIKAELDSIETLIYDKTDFERLYSKIDIVSFVDWWIVHELTQNAEPNGPRSCYMHKGVDGKIAMGPVWDFDLAFITVGLDDGGDIRPARFNRKDVKLLTGDSIYNSNALWYDRLLKEKKFITCLRERWHKLKPHFIALAEKIDIWKKLITPSALDDEKLWHGQDPARFDIYTDFVDSAENLKRTYKYRITALDKLIEIGLR